jgi:phosphotransferase system HPr-like phosphotransfer protein
MPKASQMTARDENGEHQRPAAKIMIEVHRMSTAAALNAAPTQEEQG